jgi:hypothetical protein
MNLLTWATSTLRPNTSRDGVGWMTWWWMTTVLDFEAKSRVDDCIYSKHRLLGFAVDALWQDLWNPHFQ